VFEIGEVPVPVLKQGEVLVQVEASSVNPIDCYVRTGGLRRFRHEPFPIVPGVDLSGTIIQCNGVDAFRIGDSVFGFLPRIGGAYAEFAACDVRWLSRKPPQLSYLEAAVIPCVGLTALQALRDKASLQRGQRVLIVGAAGGVGTMAVQIARILGARITAVCSGSNLDRVLALGAERVTDYMTTTPAFDNESFDAVLDCVGHRRFWSYRRWIKSAGRHVGISCSRRKTADALLSRIIPGPKSIQFHVRPSASDLAQLAIWIEDGRLKPIVSHVFDMSDIAAAHRQCKSRHTYGKIAVKTGISEYRLIRVGTSVVCSH
jgi:NADPH:quinone reductase-like Zn-dependent oxidoreductase